MRKLSDEIHVGVYLVLDQLKYQGFENDFLSKNNTKFSTISYILAEEEFLCMESYPHIIINPSRCRANDTQNVMV